MHIMREHPGWDLSGTRVVRILAGTSIAAAPDGAIVTTQVPGSGPAPAVDVYDPATLTTSVPEELRAALDEQGPVSRLRNPDLWDAIGTAIIRQVIRADQARLMYRRFTAAFGEPVTAEDGRLHVFPAPETVLGLDDGAFAELGMAFKRRPLRAAAAAFLDLGVKWAALPPADLAVEIQSVPRIGPWTASATVADYSGDFSLYPYGDMAVRKYARQSAPSLDLPETDPEFAARWEGYTSTPRELSVLTVLTLALGGNRGKAQPLE